MAKRILVSGATGLIGAALVRKFAAEGHAVGAAVRNVEKAQKMFAGLANVEIAEWDVTKPGGPRSCAAANAQERVSPVDWFVHAAAETSSRAFVERPVETIASILDGTWNALEFARTAKVGSMVYLSTMEVYGAPTAARVAEGDYGYLDPVAVRSCYPEAKRMAENLCVSYAGEYGVPVKIARLTQTFGEGVRYDDGRVFAEFARAILEKRDIVLKTEGTTARCYCYLGDALDAIETILEKGETATPYTVANEDTFCTVREMAEALCAAHPASGSKVVFDFDGAAARGFAPPFRMRLDCSRLRALGWEPKVGLMEMFDRMMGAMRC
jgi:nucleoside-diphosphate-sugar epimerase